MRSRGCLSSACYLTILQLCITQISGADIPCTTNCDCSRQRIPLLGDQDYFIVECFGDSIDVANVSNADAFSYKASVTHPRRFNFSILHDFYRLKSLSIDTNLASFKSILSIGSLKSLHVTNTRITFISNDVISKISKELLLLSLSYNLIDYINANAFNNLHDLQYLNLSHNELSRVPSASLAHLTKLRELDLSHNQIESAASSIFVALKSLEWISLEGNRIHSLAAVNFHRPDIVFLIQSNPLDSISWKYSTRTHMHKLDISGNHLTTLSPDTFVNVTIDTLIISNCPKLQIIDANVFTSTSVTTMQLTNNVQLQFIDPDALQKLQTLKTIDVSYNKLGILPQTWSQISTLQTIVAYGNSLFCDCNFRWVAELLSLNRSKVVLSPATESRCGITSATINVSIIPQECSPRLIYRSSNATTIKEGLQVKLQCKVSGVPPPTVQWFYGNRAIQASSDVVMVKTDLVISQTKYSNSGTYQCVAKNNQGPTVRGRFYLQVTKDTSKIIIRNIGKDFVEYFWQLSYPSRLYKAILIEVRNNNQTSYIINHYARSRHSPTGSTIFNLQSDTTYRLCLAYRSQERVNSEKCNTFTTKPDSEERPSGITDYSLYGIIVASIVSVIFISIIVCVCVTSRNYSRRKKKEMREGMGSDSTYALMTTSFSQRSGISSLYDNPGVSITPTSQMSRVNSQRRVKRGTASELPTPSSAVVYFSPNVTHYDDVAGTVVHTLTRTMSDPILSTSRRY